MSPPAISGWRHMGGTEAGIGRRRSRGKENR